MTSSKHKLITVVGGSGFVGRHVVQHLAAKGHRMRIAVRRPDLALHLQPLGSVGQIMPVQANVRYPASLEAACQGADVVINLTGILSETSTQTFEGVHVFGARAVATAAKKCGASQLLHMSAIGADENSPSAYGKSKFLGEKAIKEVFPSATLFRPSVIFGPEDEFFNKFAGMARFSPALPLIGGGKTRFQPVYVADIATAMTNMIGAQKYAGKTFELGGPQIFTFRELMRFTLDTIERRRLLVPVPWFAAKAIGTIAGILPNPALTRDQVLLLQSDNVVSEAATKAGLTLKGLGLTPESIETRVPPYLFRYRKFGQFTETGSSSI